jgi:hypothetical protein
VTKKKLSNLDYWCIYYKAFLFFIDIDTKKARAFAPEKPFLPRLMARGSQSAVPFR